MNIKTIGAFFLVALISLVAVSAVDMSAVVKVSKTQLNGLDLSEAKLHSFTRGSDLNLELTLEGLQTFQNVEMTATIAGSEFNDITAVKVFSVREGIMQNQNVKLHLPETLASGEYTLAVTFNSRNAEALRLFYKIDVSVPEHAVAIKEVLVTPAKQVRAGEALLVKARLSNKGANDEDVRVEANAETLNTKQATYTTLNADDEKTTEELFLPIDACATAGKHTVTVKASYNDGKDSSTASYDVDILAGNCAGAGSKTSSKTFLENALLVLVVLVLIVALIVGFSRLRNSDED